LVVQTRREFDKHVMDLRARRKVRCATVAGTFPPRACSDGASGFRPAGSATAAARAMSLRADKMALGLRARLEDSRKR